MSPKKLSKSEAGRLGSIVTSQILRARKTQRMIEYNKSPTLCKYNNCHNMLSFEQSSQKYKFCSRACARRSGRTGRQASLSICLHPSCNNQIKTYMGKYCSKNCYQDHISIKNDTTVENGLGTAINVKKYLIKYNENRCMDPNCIWDFDKRPIKCDIEHIDGNSDNNLLENCILLCPNCHSLTPTYKSKNKGNGRWARRKRYSDNKSY